MHRGYTKAWKKELQSDIWKMPPLYHRVFYYLRQKAKYQTELFPTRGLGIWVTPGMLITSISAIAEGVSYLEWGVQKTPNKKIISEILKWLKKNNMIALESNDRGTTINILNWDTYQFTDNEKVTQDIPQDIPQSILSGNAEYPQLYNNKKVNKANKAKKQKPIISDESIPYAEIIKDLNEQTGKNYLNTTEGTRDMIRLLWKQGFKFEHFKKVHSNMSVKWKNDPEKNQYLRPATLYQPKKFEGYLNLKVFLSDKGTVSTLTEKNLSVFENFNVGGKNVE